MPLAQGQLLQNRYRIVKLIGQGGFGAVYRAWDISLDMPVAIKENLDTSPEAQQQFGYEAKILARLSHPHLPRVTDHFFIPGQGQYLVMDFVEGEDLQAMLDQLGPLPEAQVLPWIEQVCDALAYLHSQNPPIIHRDLKPANIKIRPDGRAMLVDFGIAKVYDPNLSTTVGARAVTPGFSPPEQYGQGKTDARSDIYALGATLYTLLTGQVPPESVQLVAGNAQLTPPRQVNLQVSPSLEQAVLKALKIDTRRRFQSVAKLQTALRPALPRQLWPALLGGVGLIAVIAMIAGLTARSLGGTLNPGTPVGTILSKEIVTSEVTVSVTPALPTHTPRPTATWTPTDTSVPPTDTPRPTPTRTPTNTSVPPTDTPLPTPNLLATPTIIPPSPTASWMQWLLQRLRLPPTPTIIPPSPTATATSTSTPTLILTEVILTITNRTAWPIMHLYIFPLEEDIGENRLGENYLQPSGSISFTISTGTYHLWAVLADGSGYEPSTPIRLTENTVIDIIVD